MAANSTVMYASRSTFFIPHIRLKFLPVLCILNFGAFAQKELPLLSGPSFPLKPNGIIINEIMFDPGPGKEEFIEIYNRSPETYDLNELFLKVESTTATGKIPSKRISNEAHLFRSGEYRVLTKTKEGISKQYPLLSQSLILEVPGFRPLSNEGGIITLTDSTGTVIDRASFSGSLHFQLLRFTTGVSLERVDPDGESGSKDNWHSAAEAAGFATPGKINSQHKSLKPSAKTFILEPEMFTPDNDGRDDNLLIRYSPDKPGCLMTILIHDLNGKQIRKLADNVLLASDNTFSWDGFSDNHLRVSAGIYIVYGIVYSANGEVKHFKKATILATSLKR